MKTQYFQKAKILPELYAIHTTEYGRIVATEFAAVDNYGNLRQLTDTQLSSASYAMCDSHYNELFYLDQNGD